MIPSPMEFLVLLVIASIAARVTFVIARRKRRRELVELARSWRMHYSPHDRFDLADRVAQRFPLAGAAELRVADVIYGTEQESAGREGTGQEGTGQEGSGEFYRYIFAAEFTTGVTRGKHRHRRVASLRESKKRSSDWSPLILAAEELPVIEQYRSLKPADEKR